MTLYFFYIDGDAEYHGTLKEARAQYDRSLKGFESSDVSEIELVSFRLAPFRSQKALALACLNRKGFVLSGTRKVLKHHSRED